MNTKTEAMLTGEGPDQVGAAMIDELRRTCKHGLPRAYCAHCQGPERGTDDNPRFSLREDFDYVHGYRVVEVLKNGGPVHLFDRHFRFGRRKAEMLLACPTVLEKFGWSTDDDRLRFQPRVVEDPSRSLKVQVYVEMHRYFRRSTGEIVERPWLRLQAMLPDQHHLGLGAMKCRAVWAVREELGDWVRKQPS